MKTLINLKFITALSCLLSFTITAEAATRAEIKRMVINQARNSNVPVSLALAVAKVESDFNEKALSSAGARGVMQIMPATGRYEFGLTADQLWNPELNIRTGIKFLEMLHRQYDQRWDLALSHYNGGTLKGQGQQTRPHKRTRKYVATIFRWKEVYAEQARLWDMTAPELQPLRLAEHAPANEENERAEAIRTLREETRRRAEDYYVQNAEESPRDQFREYKDPELRERPDNLFMEYQDQDDEDADEDRFFEDDDETDETEFVSVEPQTTVFVEKWHDQNARIITTSNPPVEYVQRRPDYLFFWKPWRPQKFKRNRSFNRARLKRRFH